MIFDVTIEVSAISMYVLIIIVVILASVFFSFWGDKMQFAKPRNILLMSLIVMTPPIVLTTLFFLWQDSQTFFDNINLYSLIDFGLIIVVGLIGKFIFYKTIPFKEIREIGVLEKGQKLLEVNDLKVHYPLYLGILKRMVGSVKAVDGVSFEIKTGETLGLVGESGCGKTTIAKHLLGLVPKVSGEVIYKGEPIPSRYPNELRQKIQIVFQDPDASLNPRMKIFEIIAEPLKNLLGITDNEILRQHVLRLLIQVSLKREHMDRFPHEFSGGQKQRIVIARALACNPDLIILDEPTSALDVSVQAQILNLLNELQDKYGYGFLFITHNLSVVNHIADNVAVMYLGKFVETGTNDQIFENTSHPYSKALLASRSEIDPENQDIVFIIEGEVPSPIFPPSGCAFNPRCSSDRKNSMCTMDPPEPIEIEPGHFIWCSSIKRTDS
jgi:oligopeptide transport system ATP-binding protein